MTELFFIKVIPVSLKFELSPFVTLYITLNHKITIPAYITLMKTKILLYIQSKPH